MGYFDYLTDPNIVVPPIAELDRLLSKVKVALFRQKGATFLASLLCQVEIIWDYEIETACTNGKAIKWNPKFFMILPQETRVFILAHEVWHIAFLHCDPAMRAMYNPMWFNQAADHVINTMLLTQGYTAKGIPFPLCEDMKYLDWSVDRVYHDLIDGMPEGSPTLLPMTDDVKELLDNQQEVDKMVRSVVSAQQASEIAGERGVIPGEVTETLHKYLHPILPWEILVQQWLNEKAQSDYSYRRPNRRYDDPILPSMISEGALEELNWYIDVSGSVTSDMILRFYSEIKYVIDTFYPVKVNIIQFDSIIQREDSLEPEDDFTEFEIVGRGGTDLDPVREHIVKTNPTAAIIFSDLECPPMAYVNTPVLWAVFSGVGGAYGHRPEYGTVIDVRERKSLR